jgi:5-methylcytosine-specific restriction protein A
MRMPPMVIDEVILLIDTYFKICATDDKSLQKFYREDLSATLRRLPFFPELDVYDDFRSTAGMTWLIINLNFAISGKNTGQRKLSKFQKQVYDRYRNDMSLLENVSHSIKSISTLGLEPDFHIEWTNTFIGGSLLLGYHIYIETKSDLAIYICKNLRDSNICKCSICLDDLSFTYGSKAASLMELHLAAPVEWYTLKTSPATNQFILLCPNCHRFAHSDVSLFDESQLRLTVKL